MFWSLLLEPGKRYTKVVDSPFCISAAVLDTTTQDHGVVRVMVDIGDTEALIANLSLKLGILQFPLKLKFASGSRVSFYTTGGKSSVHLSGYVVFEDEVLSEDDNSSDEEIPNLVSASVKRKPEDNLSAESKKAKLPKSMPTTQTKEVPGVSPKKTVKNSIKEAIAKARNMIDEEDGLDMDESDEFVFEEEEDDMGEEEEDDSDEMEDDSEEGEEEEEEEEEEEDDSEEEESTGLSNQNKKQGLFPKNDTMDLKTNKATKVSSVPKSQQKTNAAAGTTPKKASGTADKSKNASQKSAPQSPASAPQTPTQNGKSPKVQNATPKDGGKSPQSASKPAKVVKAGGVMCEDLAVGRGPLAKSGKMVSVYYEGRLATNKKMFDKCDSGKPFRFRLGGGEVIKGWDVGVVGMQVGGKRRITCPPNMAYGKKGAPPDIPPHASLVFVVELKGTS